jgi:nucleoside-diphosphate-sugar epimerase
VRRALVTGGSGFVASPVVQSLLEGGWRVHATVRNIANSAKREALDALRTRFPGRLVLFEADLLTEGSFDDPMRGCDAVFHRAAASATAARPSDTTPTSPTAAARAGPRAEHGLTQSSVT